MLDIDQFKLAKLARERAKNLRPLPKILEAFGVSEDEFAEIEQRDDFKQIVEQHRIEWNSAAGTVERVKLSSAVLLEDGLVSVATRMTDPKEPLAACIDAAKMLAKNAGIGEKEGHGAETGERILITIDLGGDSKLEIDATKKVVEAPPKVIEHQKDGT